MTDLFQWFQNNGDVVFELVMALILLLEIIVNIDRNRAPLIEAGGSQAPELANTST